MPTYNIRQRLGTGSPIDDKELKVTLPHHTTDKMPTYNIRQRLGTGRPIDDKYHLLSMPPHVLKQILNEATTGSDEATKASTLTSVCKDFNHILAPKIYDKVITLQHTNDKWDFGAIDVADMRHANLRRIRHIWLNRQTAGRGLETGILNYNMSSLLETFSQWDPADCSENLTLEINVHTVSRNMKWFKGFYFNNAYYDDDDDDGHESPGIDPKHHDPRHGWVKGEVVMLPPVDRLIKMFMHQQPLWGSECFKTVGHVDVVKRFIIRRQLRRSPGPAELYAVLSKLQGLEHLELELWRPLAHFRLQGERKAMSAKLLPNLPKTLKTLRIFEESNDSIAGYVSAMTVNMPEVDAIDRVWKPVPNVFWITAWQWFGWLEELSLSFLVDARDFFWNGGGGGGGNKKKERKSLDLTWPNLKRLTLTCPILSSYPGDDDDKDKDNRCRETNELLRVAGVAALRAMPKLECLVLWNGGRHHAYKFAYRRLPKARAAFVEVRSIRGLWEKMDDAVVEVWNRVAMKSGISKGVYVRCEEMPCCSSSSSSSSSSSMKEIISHGDAIVALDLPVQVVSNVSLWQMRREAAMMAKQPLWDWYGGYYRE